MYSACTSPQRYDNDEGRATHDNGAGDTHRSREPGSRPVAGLSAGGRQILKRFCNGSASALQRF